MEDNLDVWIAVLFWLLILVVIAGIVVPQVFRKHADAEKSFDLWYENPLFNWGVAAAVYVLLGLAAIVFIEGVLGPSDAEKNANFYRDGFEDYRDNLVDQYP